MPKSKSSSRWLQEHATDTYVKKASKAGYRSRAVYKLLELQQKYRLIKPGMCIVDLGAAPGGWSQVAIELVTRKGSVFALDILPMAELPQVGFIQGDFTEQATLEELLKQLDGKTVDIVLSDMAPNMSGLRSVDQPQAMELSELALDFARQVLKPKGDFLAKVFQGEGFDAYVKSLRGHFSKVIISKPDASRDRSREVYCLARELKK